MSRCAEYDIVPEYNKALELMTCGQADAQLSGKADSSASYRVLTRLRGLLSA
jgi:hypothetical protein